VGRLSKENLFMPRGGPRGGGINLRALAIRQLKSRLTIDAVTAHGLRVLAPGQNFEDITSALAQLAVVKKLGIPNIRYLRKKLSVAREFFKKPNHQLHLNQISALIDHAEEVCLNRVERRKEKRMLQKIVEPVQAAASAPSSPAPNNEIVSVWEQILADQEKKNANT
jgi:hypothetical protein